MDATAFLEAVREENATPLDRLGSERALVATTAASIDRRTVLETSVAAEARAAATFEAWADDEDDDTVRGAFADAAALEREHLERVESLPETGTFDRDVEPDALHAHLRGLDATVDRVGAGLVGRPLVASRTLLQVINFFVNEGDSRAADRFRELRAETDEQATTGAELVLDRWEDRQARERAQAAAGHAITVAYEEYADRLSEMGVDPKPVC